MKKIKSLYYVTFRFDVDAEDLFQFLVIWLDQERGPVQEIAQLCGTDIQYDADTPFATDVKNLIVVGWFDSLWKTSADREVRHIRRGSNTFQHFLLFFPRYEGTVVYELILRCAVVQKNIDACNVVDYDGNHLKPSSAGLLYNIAAGESTEESHDL